MTVSGPDVLLHPYQETHFHRYLQKSPSYRQLRTSARDTDSKTDYTTVTVVRTVRTVHLPMETRRTVVKTIWIATETAIFRTGMGLHTARVFFEGAEIESLRGTNRRYCRKIVVLQCMNFHELK